jgi:hypothetical protein
MPDYQKSKIYKIVCDVTNSTYYGSTIQTLSRRMTSHRIPSNGCNTKHMIEPKIYLVEEYPCNNKEQLLQRERYYIENNECCNIKVPFRSKEEYKEQRKEYREKNREIINEKLKEYYHANKEQRKEYRKKNKDIIKEYYEKYREVNKEELKEYNKEYRKKNKEELKEYDKEYKEKNKEKINKRRRIKYQEKITCECGTEVSRQNVTRHKRTIKHINYINKSITL